MNIILHEKLSKNLQCRTKIKPRGNDETISTSVKADKPLIHRIDASQYAVSNLQNRNLFSKSKKTTLPSLNRLNDDIPEDFKTPLTLGRPFLSTAHAIINVFKAKIILSIGIDKIFFKSNKPTSNIIKRVYALSLIKSIELDFEARLMGNALRKNRLHDPKFEDFIELNDPNEPIKPRRNQVKVFVPTIDEGKGMDEPIIEDIETKFDNIGYNKDECEYFGFYNFCHP
ncbi:hypothetical protein Tco_1330799 [Tanacetum coccineum]